MVKKLAGKTVDITSSMKILGQILTSDGKDLEHMNKRKSATNDWTLTGFKKNNLLR